MSKEIILNEIILAETGFISTDNRYLYNIDDLKRCLKEACKQTLELAARNAEWIYYDSIVDIPRGTDYVGDDEYGYYAVDKKSILNTINQIK